MPLAGAVVATSRPDGSVRPEIRSAMVATQVTDAIRKALTNSGLSETADHADVVVEPSVSTRPIVQRRGNNVAPVTLIESTLIIDLTSGGTGKPIWHAVQQRPAEQASKIAVKLPEDAQRLLSAYPPKKKQAKR